MSQDTTVRYRINDRNEITFVNDAWRQFAQANEGGDLAGGDVIGRILWDFISDETTQELYKEIVGHVRQGRHAQFKLRCDSPSYKRLLEMTISRVDAGVIEFATRTLLVEVRETISLLARHVRRSDALIRCCAWCNRIDVDGRWSEIEDAVTLLQLFESPELPQITHGICEVCLEKMIREIEKMKDSV